MDSVLLYYICQKVIYMFNKSRKSIDYLYCIFSKPAFFDFKSVTVNMEMTIAQ